MLTRLNQRIGRSAGTVLTSQTRAIQPFEPSQQVEPGQLHPARQTRHLHENFSTSRPDSSSQFDGSHPAGEPDELYPGHQPSTGLQKLLLFVGSSAISLVDQYRDDLVGISGETSGRCALESMARRMEADPEGARILRDRPRISSQTVDLGQLRSLPSNTLGARYVAFMDRHQISCDTRKPVKYVDDERLAYVMQRYRETHDLAHLLLRQRPDMLGEVVVKWVEALQTGLPMCYGAALGGQLRLSARQRRLYREGYLHYALASGKQARLFVNCYFEQRWTQDLDELRAELNIPPSAHERMLP